MSQNIIDVSWDIEKFDLQTKEVIARMEAVYELSKQISQAAIKPGSNGGYTELIKKIEQFNTLQGDSIKLTKLQEQAEQARLRTQKLTQQALEAEAKARKATEQANLQAAKSANELNTAKLTEVKLALEQEKTDAVRIKSLIVQERELERLIALEEEQKAASAAKIVTVDGGSRFTDQSQTGTAAQVTEFERLRQAEADASMAAVEYGNSVNQIIPAVKVATQADAELVKAQLLLKKANSEQNVQLQGLNAERQLANKAAKEEALTALGLLGPYQQLSKEYAVAAMNAKDLAVQFGVDSVEAKEAAATAIVLNTELQTIDKTVGQSQKNVGNYANGVEKGMRKVWGGLRKIAYILPGIGIAGLLSFAVEPVINFYKWLTRASDAAQLFADKMSMLNDVRKAADKDAGKEIEDLKILYQGTTDVTVAVGERIKAAKYLQETYPETFKNFTTEDIMLGKAKEGYDQLTEAILKTALAKAAQNKLQELASEKLDAENQKQKIRIATLNEENAARDRRLASQTTGSSLTGGGAGGGDVVITRAEQIAKIDERRKKALKEQDDILTGINAKEKFLIDFVGEGNLIDVITAKKDKKGSSAKGSVTLESTKEQIDLEFELYKISQQRKIKLLNDEANDTKKSFGDRMLFAEDYYIATKELAERTAQHEIDADADKLKVMESNYVKAKGTEKNNLAIDIANQRKQIVIATAKKNDELISLQIEFNSRQDAIAKDELKRQEEIAKQAIESIKNVNNEQQGAIGAIRATEKASHDKLLADKSISQEHYDKLEKQSIKDSLILQLQSDLQKEQSLRSLAKLRGEDLTKYDNEITTLKAKIVSAQNTPIKKPGTVPSTSDSELSILKSTEGLINSLVDEKYQHEINAIQKVIDLNNFRKDQEINNINISTLSNQEKAEQMILLDKNVAANNRKLQREQVALQVKQAKFDRDSAIAQIIQNATIAEFKLPAQEGFAGIAAGVAIGIEAAAQIAMLLSKPLPQMPAYAEGTDFHPGGPAIVGEGKINGDYQKELVEMPGGKSFVTSGPMLLNNLPTGSKVMKITKDEIHGVMYRSMVVSTVQMLQANENASKDNGLNEIRDAIYETGRMTTSALRRQKNATVILNVTGYFEAYITKAVKE